MPRYFIKLSYNGSEFHGWQIQPGVRTVQEELGRALTTLLRTPTEVTGCGRTDTGVHASEFYAHFDSHELPDLNHVTYKINALTPPDIGISEVIRVADDAHARFGAIRRKYRYLITREKDPFLLGKAFYWRETLNLEQMNHAMTILMQHSDFTSMSKTHTQVKTNECQVYSAKWMQSSFGIGNTPCTIFEIEANRFLRGMVRAIVGTSMQVGLGKLNPDTITSILEEKNRSAAGESVPPQGLYLCAVSYPSSILSSWQA